MSEQQKSKPGDPLTARQQEALAVIERHHAEHGYGPSIRDVGRALGGITTNGVVYHLRALRTKGYITFDALKARSITLRPQAVTNNIPGTARGNGQMMDEMTANARVAELEAKLNRLYASFALRQQADLRGIERWRQAAPGRDLEQPDHADLVCFLLERIEELERRPQ